MRPPQKLRADLLRHRRPAAGPGRRVAAVPPRRRRAVDGQAAHRRAGCPQRDLHGRVRRRPRPSACSTSSRPTPAVRPWRRSTVLNTVRQAYQLCDRDDRVAVEVVDDTVTRHRGPARSSLKFREIEVERKAGKAKLLDRVEVALRDAGATVGEFTPKHVRALGLPALRPAGLARRRRRGCRKRPTAADVVDRGDPARHRPHRRPRPAGPAAGPGRQRRHRRAPDAGRLPAAAQRPAHLRRGARPGLESPGCAASSAGSPTRSAAARDAEVLRARLRHTAELDPLVPLDDASRRPHRRRPRRPARGRAAGAGQGDVRGALPPAAGRAAGRGARHPQLTEAAGRSRPRRCCPGWSAGRGGAFAFGGNGVPGAGQLDPTAADDELARGAHQRQAGPLRRRRGGRRARRRGGGAGQRAGRRCRTCWASTRTPPSPRTPGWPSPTPIRTTTRSR